MKNPLLSLLLATAAWCSIGSPAAAAPLVADGASYSVFIRGGTSDEPTMITGAFDGVASETTRSGLTLSLSESETGLGSSRSRIMIDLSASGDLLPVDGEAVALGFGVWGDGLNFNVPVTLESVVIRFYAGDAILGQSADLTGWSATTSPWNGIFPDMFVGLAFGGMGGRGVNHISFEFDIADAARQVPEPGSVLLAVLALAACGAARRARRA